jgi:hypothetical protein
MEQQQVVPLQPTGQSQSIDQLQPMGQNQPIGQPQYMDQQQPVGQRPMDYPQSVGQPQFMDQQPVAPLQPAGQSLPIDQQLPIDYQQYIDQQLFQKQQQLIQQQQSIEEHQPTGQQQPLYNQPQQSYCLNPPYQQPTYQQPPYQQSQQSYNREQHNQHSHNQQSSGQHAYGGYSQHAQHGYMNPDYTNIGGWLLVFIIYAIVNLMFRIFNTVPGITATVTMLSLSGTLEELFSDGMVTALSISLLAQIIAIGAHVLFAIVIIQIFIRKSSFLLFLQLSFIIVVFSNFFTHIAANMFVTELSLVMNEDNLYYFRLHNLADERSADEIAISQAALFGLIVINIVATLLFTLFFSRSHRVWAYMGSEEFKRKALFAFKKSPMSSRR